jgi:hypothetical protein
MKKLLLGALLFLSTTKAFSQNVTNFGLYIINPTNCPYSITGYWVDSIGIEGPLFFTVGDTSSTFQDIWYGQAVSTSATSNMSICVVPAPPCNCPPACIQQIPVTQGSYTILLCDSIVGIEEQPISSLLDNKYYDLLGREIKDITAYPMDSIYIKNGRKYIKIKQ